jgi:hypothetical protein
VYSWKEHSAFRDLFHGQLTANNIFADAFPFMEVVSALHNLWICQAVQINTELLTKIIFPSVLHKYKTWYISIKGEERHGIIQNKVLKENRDKVTRNGSK